MDSPEQLARCPHCGRDVPLHNKDVHTARCGRRTANKSQPIDDPSTPICLNGNKAAPPGVANTVNTVEPSRSETRPHTEVIDLVDDDAPSAPPAPPRGISTPASPGVQALSACPQCSALNDVGATACHICGAEPALTWQCGRCTYSNAPNASICGMCAIPKDGILRAESFSSDMDIIEEDERATSGWTCTACTYANTHSGPDCEMCGHTKPGARASHSTHRSSPGFSSSSSDSHMVPATVFGGVLGAGAAYLENRSVLGGALQGAGLGMMGGLLMDQQGGAVRERYTRTGPHYYSSSSHRVRPARAGLQFVPGGMLDDNFGFNYSRVYRNTAAAPLMFNAGPDIDRMDYDELYARFGGPTQKPASVTTISSLPVEVLAEKSSSSSSSASASDENKSCECAICLDDMVAGDRVQTLPCLHRFHQNCSEKWLQQSGKCPVCKYEV